MIISDFFAKFASEYYIVRIFEVFHGANPIICPVRVQYSLSN